MRWSYVSAALIVVVLGVWMGSAYVGPLAHSEAKPEAAAAAAEAPKQLFKVRVKTFQATQREATITARGVTQASKRVEVRARTKGIIESAPFEQGDAVQVGDVLCKLDIASRSMQWEQADAAVKSAEQSFNATRKLAKKDFVAEQKVLQDKAALDVAKAAREQIERDTEWTEVKAPIRGVLVEKPAEIGNLLEPGTVCATISMLDPVLVTAQVAERLIPYVREGMLAKAKLATGESVEGTVTFIGKSADLATRTFRVELTVKNPTKSIREGVTAEIFVPTPPVPSHKLPASALMLDDDGRFGVRVMQKDGSTKFTPVTMLAQERDGSWVTGLPGQLRIVIVGQDYVKDGEKVEAVDDVAELKP